MDDHLDKVFEEFKQEIEDEANDKISGVFNLYQSLNSHKRSLVRFRLGINGPDEDGSRVKETLVHLELVGKLEKLQMYIICG